MESIESMASSASLYHRHHWSQRILVRPFRLVHSHAVSDDDDDDDDGINDEWICSAHQSSDALPVVLLLL